LPGIFLGRQKQFTRYPHEHGHEYPKEETSITQATPPTLTGMEHDNGQPLYQPVSQIAENANITAYLRKKGFSTWDELYQ